MSRYLIFGAICALTAFSATADEAHHTHRPDSHAPVGAMGDHTHNTGEWMLSYRYGYMNMHGNRDEDSRVDTSDIHGSGFMVAPVSMDMHMHMFGLMYGAHDRVTLMAMLPYQFKSMDHVTAMGTRFTTDTQGIGDVKIGGLIDLFEFGEEKNGFGKHQIHTNISLSLPTGSIEEKDDTPAGNDSKLPYPMQLGSGTFDPVLSLTYRNTHPGWSWGAQAGTTLRIGENSEDYRLGNAYHATGWIAKKICNVISTSFRLEGKHWEDIHGADSELNPMMVPTARTDLQGGSRIDALIGVNLLQPTGSLAGNRLNAEFGMPVYQYLDGPQMETDYRGMVSWQFAW